MLATPRTASPATRVKSGPVFTATDGVLAVVAVPRCSGTGAEAASDGAAIRIRPVTTRPAAKPATISVAESKRRLNISRNVDVSRTAPKLRHRHRQDTILQIGMDGLHRDRFRQSEGARELAVTALDAVIALARNFATGRRCASAADRDAGFFGLNVDVLAPQSRQFRRQHVLGRRFIQVNRWCPTRGIGADQLAELLVQGEKFAQRIPASGG